jgi:hypothetical protein
MVQVDVFWSYGLGSSFAVAASRQLLRARAERKPLLESPFFTRTLLFLSVIFVPSGACLLWAFPSWETMHAGSRDLPAWLVTAFVITNVTQGLLGFLVAYWLLARGRRYAAYLQWWAAYFLMFFVLVHGWDGTGYRRFFSSTPAAFAAWHAGNVTAWLGSDVALTLYAMGAVLVPVLLAWLSGWLADGYRLGDVTDARPRRARLVALSLAVVFVGGLGGAILASLAVRSLGWLPGLATFAVVWWAIALRRGGLLERFYRGLLRWPARPAALAGGARCAGP